MPAGFYHVIVQNSLYHFTGFIYVKDFVDNAICINVVIFDRNAVYGM